MSSDSSSLKPSYALPWIAALTFSTFLLALLVVAAHTPTGAATAAPLHALSTSVVLPALADTYVDSSNPTTNFGGAGSMAVSWSGQPDSVQRAFVVFELGSIPPGAYIERATLKATVVSAGSKGQIPLTVARVNGAWSEGGLTWNNQPPATDPYSSATSDQQSSDLTWDVTTLVSGWRAGTYPNFGVIVHGPEGYAFNRMLNAREKSAAELHVTYWLTPPAATQTPTATPVGAPLALSIGSGWGVQAGADGATPVPNLDLAVTGIEVTQGIQCYQSDDTTCADDSVPLVLNRPTLARVYVQVLSGSLAAGGLRNVPVRLNLYMSGGRIFTYTSYLTAKASPSRNNLLESANTTFSIVGSGNTVLTMRAEVNPDRNIAETDYSNNRYPPGDIGVQGFAFADVPSLFVQTAGIGYNDGTTYVAPPFYDSLNTFNFLKQTYPVPDVIVLPSPIILLLNRPLATNASWWNIVNTLYALKSLALPIGLSHIYGLIDPAVPNTSGFSGFAYTPAPTDNSGDFWIASGINGNGPTAAQEIAHNYSRNHAPGCATVGVDSLWPPSISNGRSGDVGWDRDSNTLRLRTTLDFMGYCGPYWISGYTTKGIYARRQAILGYGPQPAMAHQATANRDYDVVAGSIYTDGLVTTLPIQRVALPEGSHDQAGSGPYSLELRSAGDELLFTRNFNTHLSGCSGDCEHAQAVFAETVPFTPTLHRIVIKQGLTVLHTITASLHVPSVILQSPNGGEVWGQSTAHNIAWSGGDGDGDVLYYSLLFSHDGGANWNPVMVNITATSVILHATLFPGTTQGRFRVIVSDGFNSTSDDSDADFTIERKPPTAIIHSPTHAETIRSGIPVVLQGAASDLEDGQLSGNQYTWESDRDGVIGHGRTLIWGTASPGQHTISLTVRDSHGDVGSATVRVNFGQQIYLPIIER